MKRIKLNLALAAVLLAAGSALATTNHQKFTAPNYYNSGTLANPNWVQLTRSIGTVDDPGTYRCDIASDYCTAYFSSPPASNQVPTSDFASGNYVENN